MNSKVREITIWLTKLYNDIKALYA
jgi:hypothetical protein